MTRTPMDRTPIDRTFIIVRHGNTFDDGETPRRIGAATDLPLVASGRAQAQRLGARFAAEGWRFDRILCSPLRRTRETAEAIRATVSDRRHVEVSTLLAEIDHGPDENRPEDAVVARVGRHALDDWDRHGTAPDGWILDRQARIAGWQALFAEGGSGTALLVTSNGAARFALLARSGLAEALPSLKLRTGAFGIVRVGDAGPRIAAWDERP